jgi:hypothetical protein
MSDFVVTDPALEDYVPVIEIAAKKFGSLSHFESVVEFFELDNVQIPGGNPNARQYWEALFHAAIQDSVNTPRKLAEYLVTHGVPREDMDRALAEVAKKCMLRGVLKKHPNFYYLAGSLLEAQTVPAVRQAARDLREAAIGIWRLLAQPVLADSFIQISPAVQDPEQRRRQLADLAVNVVTAVDYLLNFLPASSDEPEDFALRPDHVPDDGAAVRLIQRRLDARATAVKVGGRFLDGLRRDVATL